MNRYLLTATLAGLLCVAAGCDFLDTDDSNEIIVEPPLFGVRVTPAIIDTQIDPSEYPDDDYQIMAVPGTDTLSATDDVVKVGTLARDTLVTRVRSGGCGKDMEFQLVSDGAFTESSPVQMGVRLFHDVGGSACMMLIDSTVGFDLTPLRERYQEAYGADSGTLLLNFKSEAEKTLQVKYEF